MPEFSATVVHAQWTSGAWGMYRGRGACTGHESLEERKQHQTTKLLQTVSHVSIIGHSRLESANTVECFQRHWN